MLFGIIQVLCCVPTAVKAIRQADIGEPLLDVELRDEMEDVDPEADPDGDWDAEDLGEEEVGVDTANGTGRSEGPGSSAGL